MPHFPRMTALPPTPSDGFPMRALALSLALLASPAAADTPLVEAVAGMDLFPCDLSSLSCTTLTVPLDHRANDPSQTIDITFALSFATVESKGILFFFVGGPGGSGLASADSYLSAFDESLSQYIDIVFVDQRGIGPKHGLSCPIAQARFDIAPASINAPDQALATAQAFARDCTAELDADHLLPVVNSDQAIRDFEAFRQAIGAPKVWMYGESYGTQVVQAYATLYPQAVRGVILDGVVDLNLDAEGFYAAYAVAAESILSRSFAACADIAACAADMGGDATQVYDDLAGALAQAPVLVDLTLADGTVTQRALTSGILEANAFYALYSPEGRAEFLRALAATGRGNLVPMLQLGYANMYIDPETETGIEDPGWFAAAFYAVTCTDYDSGAGTEAERTAAILEEARAFASNAPRLLRSYFLERLACAYWPYQGPATRPEPYAGGPWPTLVLNSDADPITPITMATSVLNNAQNAYGVFMRGGPHVIWGRGLACPDAIVQALLFDGTLPSAREQHCEQDLVGPYTPLTLTTAAEMADPVAVARAVETELYQIIPLNTWDMVHPLTIGCDLGGTLSATPSFDGIDYTFANCRLWPDLAISGQGVEVNTGEDRDGITLTLAVSGLHSGNITYRYSKVTEAWSISGTWDGQPASLDLDLP
ncbi:alpha/beta fold hydrolase [Tabrizicola piscis]|uniref:Proline iminopeptidase n=2 Tax=Tabrizicola piscis TaxID=2494374 RepID=A0A3S8U6Q1_9RHOB|nr:alpha/beta fold hydrolase [Tabrizicola piscis]